MNRYHANFFLPTSTLKEELGRGKPGGFNIYPYGMGPDFTSKSEGERITHSHNAKIDPNGINRCLCPIVGKEMVLMMDSREASETSLPNHLYAIG